MTSLHLFCLAFFIAAAFVFSLGFLFAVKPGIGVISTGEIGERKRAGVRNLGISFMVLSAIIAAKAIIIWNSV